MKFPDWFGALTIIVILGIFTVAYGYALFSLPLETVTAKIEDKYIKNGLFISQYGASGGKTYWFVMESGDKLRVGHTTFESYDVGDLYTFTKRKGQTRNW